MMQGLLIWMYRRRYMVSIVIVLWWSIITVLGATIGIRFVNLPKVNMNPSSELPGLKALEKVYRYFPEVVQRQTMLVVVDCGSANCTRPEMKQLVELISGFLTLQLPGSRVWQYFRYSNDPLLADIEEQFISRETSSLLVLVEYRGKGLDQQVADAIRKRLGKEDTFGATVRVTSAALVHNQVGASVVHSMVNIDVWTIPLACGLLLLVLKSWRMLALVLLNVAVSVLSGWLAMYSLCHSLDLGIDHVTTVEFMHMIVLVLALDYSLFLLSTARAQLEGEGYDADWVVLNSGIVDGPLHGSERREKGESVIRAMKTFSSGVLGIRKGPQEGPARLSRADQVKAMPRTNGRVVVDEPREDGLFVAPSSNDRYVPKGANSMIKGHCNGSANGVSCTNLDGARGPRLSSRVDARGADSAGKPLDWEGSLEGIHNKPYEWSQVGSGTSSTNDGKNGMNGTLPTEPSWGSSNTVTTDTPSPLISQSSVASDASSAEQLLSDERGFVVDESSVPTPLGKMEIAAAKALRLNVETILSSACALAAVFLGFVLLDNARLRINGVASAVGALVVATVCLSLTPAMLLLFPSFFGGGFLNIRMARCLPEVSSVQSYWKVVGYVVTKWPCNAIVIAGAFIFLAPLAFNARDLHTSMNQWMLTSRDNEEHATWVAALARFPPGLIEPSSLLLCIEPSEQDSGTYQYELLLTQLTKVAADALVAEGLSPSGSIISTGYDRGYRISDSNSGYFDGGFHWLKEGRSIQSVQESLYREDIMNAAGHWLSAPAGKAKEQCTLMRVLQPHFPSDWPARSWNDRVRNVLKRSLESEASHTEVLNFCAGRPEPSICDFQISSALWNSGIVEQDQEHKEWRAFMNQFSSTIALVMLMTMVMLRSVFVSVRLAVTMVVPLLAVYGLAAHVYQDGVLGIRFPSLGGSSEGERARELESGSFYEPMVMLTLTCCFALALDYDLFLLWRIRWHRINRGVGHQRSIVLALHETGHTINWAGIIMATTFGGNLLGQVMLFNQAGWLIASSVLIDAFLVRTVLVPAICSFAPELMWWPSRPTGLVQANDDDCDSE